MELRHLRTFLAVARELHFGRAAERLHISQPPVSRCIRELEQELGTALFLRSSRSVRLTRAGEFFREEAQACIARLEAAARTLARMEQGLAGSMRVGFIGPMTHTPFPFWIKAFKQTCPEVALDLQEMPSARQQSMLQAGELDIGFIRAFGPLPEGLQGQTCISEPYILALPADHALARRTSLGLDDLRTEPWLFFPRAMHPELHDLVLSILQGEHPDVRIVQEVETKRTMLALCAAGMGLALVPASMGTTPVPGLAFVPLHDSLPPVEIRAAWREQDQHPARDRFLSHVPRIAS